MTGNTIERLMKLLFERVNVVDFGSYKDLRLRMLITPRVADENRRGAKKPPPHKIGLIG